VVGGSKAGNKVVGNNWHRASANASAGNDFIILI